ncbi:hypothetical protein T07_12109 [Trichinella nelsoni]|uniref:Uncharacterized protein n=1 Tax=Trichinella nelsoni TaxID=6336 RepID=A0A0V0RSH2_9BILA|nr:hypothetical protein T07_12109 [Trichinella nelsoni]
MLRGLCDISKASECESRERRCHSCLWPGPCKLQVSANRDDVPLRLRQTRERDVYSKLILKGNWIVNRMEDVWYVPKLGLNLFFIGKAAEKGSKFNAYVDGCTWREAVRRT